MRLCWPVATLLTSPQFVQLFCSRRSLHLGGMSHGLSVARMHLKASELLSQDVKSESLGAIFCSLLAQPLVFFVFEHCQGISGWVYGKVRIRLLTSVVA